MLFYVVSIIVCLCESCCWIGWNLLATLNLILEFTAFDQEVPQLQLKLEYPTDCLRGMVVGNHIVPRMAMLKTQSPCFWGFHKA